ncbi:SUR7/PalI family [Acrodontium crateriforme]|uniref:SUR7/PalI family n=1 Tax=Acrodontium crateriforme TaxID=150365 RepID=A0AAQ3R1W7_9PEZI|nr:SUR7/PalI family [Acrodontium crateriforme]
MGKAGRIACIFTPWALTIASFVCLLLISIAGWEKSSGELNSFYFFQADFTNLDLSAGSTLENSTSLTAALELAQKAGNLSGIYQIHLWNYCTGEETSDNSTKVDYCSKKQSNFWFNPVDVWGLNASLTTAASSASSSASSTSNMNAFESALASAANSVKDGTETLENEFLGKSGAAALNTYEKVSKWMFIGFEVSFWSTLATIIFGVLAICSRWGSFITWILSVVSTLFTFASVLTSTVMFGILVGALKTLLDPYKVSVKIGTHALIIEWIAVACSLAATLFWLLSVCCCSGRSNPHHKGNKGGLWTGDNGGSYDNQNRGFRVEKTGGYERVASPFMPSHERSQSVPMQSYSGAPPQHQHQEQGIAYEPFRHS